MNKLIVPKRFFLMGFADLSDPYKRAMSSKWFFTPIFWTFIVTVAGLLGSLVFKGEINGSSLITSLIVSAIYYSVELKIIEGYRKKIIADMESARPFIGPYSFDWHSVNSGIEHCNIIPTMAGKLKFISNQLPSFGIKRMRGELFDYYVYNDVENLDQKDLKKFVVPNDGPRI